ncbi:hypothetical protein L1987_39816 [Smallanthus sonchifolius]|uniref:Uncharacterized protein n=1 Tax=Smallanthus sonchifolius TaxID=185202 RepID=A0ACB9GS45_9ASTR|nr:hypothetical protein L1987_39816 [Smallanthus sonchifolius]
MNNISWCLICSLLFGWICGTRANRKEWEPTVLNDLLDPRNNRENKNAMKILYNSHHTHWNFIFLRVGWGDILGIGREKLWARSWDRDGKGLGANHAAFLSSDESRNGEVGTNVVAWGGGYMVCARYAWKITATRLWKGNWGHRFWPTGLAWRWCVPNYCHYYLQIHYSGLCRKNRSCWITMAGWGCMDATTKMNCLMAKCLHGWDNLQGSITVLDNWRHVWCMVDKAFWPKGKKITEGPPSVDGLKLDSEAHFLVGISNHAAAAPYCHAVWTNKIEPNFWTWNYLGYSERMMESAPNQLLMGKHGGGKKKVVQIQPSRQQPQRSTQIGATGSVIPKDSSRGWNPFAHPIPHPVPKVQGCMMNKTASTIPTVSSLSSGGFGLPGSSSGSNSSVQSSPVNPLVWADVVKGLQSGLKSGSNSGLKQVSTSLKSHVSMLAGVLPSPVALPESDGVDLVVDASASDLPELVPVVSPAMTSAPKEVHAAVTADMTEACMVNPNGLSAVGPHVHGADGPTDAGSNSVGPEITQGSGGLYSGGLNTTIGPNDTRFIDTDLDLNTGPVLDGSDGLDFSKIGPGNVFSRNDCGPNTTGLSFSVSGLGDTTGPEILHGFSSGGPETAGLRPCGTGINENTFEHLDSGPAISTPSDPDANLNNVGLAHSVGPVNTDQAKVGPGVISSPTGRVLEPKSGLHTSSFGPTTAAPYISARSLQFGSISPTIVHDDLMFDCEKNSHVASVVVPKEVVVPRGPSMVVSKPPWDDDGFVPVQSKKWRVKKPNTGGLNGMSSVAVDPVVTGPTVMGPKDVGLVDVPRVVRPPLVSKGNIRDKGKISVSNQFDSLGGPVLDDFDDFFDGVTGLWESERQTAHYYIEYGFKPHDFVFEKWSPKLKIYYSQLTKVDSIDPGGPSKVIDVVEDDEVASVADESSRFMKMS